jgi:hypothetical protein
MERSVRHSRIASWAFAAALAAVGCGDDETPRDVGTGAHDSTSSMTGDDATSGAEASPGDTDVIDDDSTSASTTTDGSDDADVDDDSTTGTIDVEPLVLHLAPDGDDDNDGTSWDDAVATIARTHELVVAHDPDRDVVIRVAAGTYVRQTVTWTHTMPDHTITIERADDDGPRPLFVGCDESGCAHTFFILNHSDGEATNLHFRYRKRSHPETPFSAILEIEAARCPSWSWSWSWS